jgi:hypothetical protein
MRVCFDVQELEEQTPDGVKHYYRATPAYSQVSFVGIGDTPYHAIANLINHGLDAQRRKEIDNE